MLTDKYYWIARYDDGKFLSQINPDGSRNSYQDIQRDKLIAFEMWQESNRVLFIRFKKSQRLIWRRRVEMSPQGIVEICHLVGKQETINGKNYQGIIGLFESDGRIETAGKFEEGHPWFFPVVVHPNEGEEWKEDK